MEFDYGKLILNTSTNYNETIGALCGHTISILSQENPIFLYLDSLIKMLIFIGLCFLFSDILEKFEKRFAKLKRIREGIDYFARFLLMIIIFYFAYLRYFK